MPKNQTLKPHSLRKDARELYEYAQSLGFEFVRYTGSGHMMLRHPTLGCSTTVALTSSSPSGFRNARSNMERVVFQARLQLQEGKP